MLDADGRFPMEGSLTDSLQLPIDICQLVGNIWAGCTNLPAALRQIQLLIPVGFALNPGSYESCLAVAADGFTGKYCPLLLNGPSGLAPDDLGRATSSDYAHYSDIIYNLEQLNGRDNFKVPNMPSYERILASYKFLSTHLRQPDGKRTFNQTVFSILDSEKISQYIMNLAADYPTEMATPDTSSQLKNILLALLAIYSAINRPVIGLCIPSSCSESDVNLNYVTMFEELNPLNSNLVPVFNTPQCYTDDNRTGVPDPLPAVDKFIFVVFAIIGVLLIGGTILDLWDTFAAPKNVKRSNIFTKSLLSFSTYTNSRHLLSTASVGSDHLDCMNGMRFLSMTWVVLGHSFFILLIPYSALRNILVVPEIMGGSAGLAFEAVLNALPSVDSFFIMSGTLTSYLMFRELDRATGDIKRHIVTFIMYYVHRYLRLTITYALIMGVIIAIVPHVYYGPGWSALNIEADACRNNWWAHFLYVNTLLKSMTGTNVDLCMGVTWYLVDDMIFHWFSPIVLYPMFILWQKTGRHVASVAYWLAVMAAFTSGIAYIAYTSQLPPADSVQSQNYHKDYTYHVDFYFVPWARYQPYLVGILLGYILHHTRGQEIVINDQLNIILWQVAFLTGFAVVYGLHDARVTTTGTLIAATFYNAFQRLAWPLALSWVIFACVKGYGGPINDFLSWSAFAPLSRLTYCSYLFHISVQQIFGASVLSTFASDFR